MTCDTCKASAGAVMLCVKPALDIIMQHFRMLQNSSVEQTSLISALQSRNDELNKALEVLQERSKRRKLDDSLPKQLKSYHVTDCSMRSEPSSPMPQTQDSLNMNIALTTTTQIEDADESIAETEQPVTGSPDYKPWCVQHKLLKRNCENLKPPECKPTNSWISKAAKTLRPTLSLAKPKAVHANNPNKMKQSRLSFDRSKSTDEKDLIESSPDLYTSLKQAKQSRTLMLRNTNNSNLHTNDVKPCASNLPHFESDDDLFFDLSPPKREPTTNVPDVSLQLPSCQSNSSSVVMLTPATQDIVFVDDSSDDSNQLNTMDLIDSFTQLKKHEAKIIDKQKQQCKQQNAKRAVAISNQQATTRIKEEPLTMLHGVGNESTKMPDDIKCDNAMEGDEQEELEEFPRPIAIKRELTLKERFNIECAQCEKFIQLMAGRLTDLQIKNHLLNCKHREELAMRPNSPEGFWNPHMLSFASDDPRNEVLIDRRFVDKKRAQ